MYVGRIGETSCPPLNVFLCLKPANVGTVVSRQIHNFSDASSTGYGQVTYLRIENEKGQIHCAFLMGKVCIAPIKTMTISHLELTAATVSVRVGEMISKELDKPAECKTYWTDSTTVLKYIQMTRSAFMCLWPITCKQ